MSGSQQQGPDKEPPPPTPSRLYQASFATGEICPSLWWRSDLAKWRAGAAKLQNMIVTPTGAATRRAGTQYVGTGKDPSAAQRLIPFQFSTAQQYVLELGNAYMRFIYQGAYLMSGGVPYEITTPYAIGDLPLLRFTQSADVLIIVHPSYPQQELKRLGALSWTLTPVTIGSQLNAPTGVTVTPVNGSGFTGSPAVLSFAYAVTAASYGDNDESVLSGPQTCSNFNLGYYGQYGTKNTIAWGAVTGADFYVIYRQYSGAWAKVGATTATSFDDTGYTPDTATAPPEATNPFSGGNYPGTVGYFQERLFYAGSAADPETLWASKSGNYTNFDASNPQRDDDGLTKTLAARQVNQIRHLVPLADLLIFTSGAGWRLSGANGAITPANFDLTPQIFTGSADVDPIVVGNRVLFVETKGASVREIVYQFYMNQYVGEDRSVYARHLFFGHQIVSWAWAESPDKVLWAIREDGVLLSMTYLIEQDIYAWTEHTTAYGSFKSVAVVTETVNGVTEDVPYFVVQRTIGASTVSMIERLHTRLLGPANSSVAQAWFVDAGLTYSGAPVSTVSGLSHLNGMVVAYLADGVPGTATVSGGAITLGAAASVITVGLPLAAAVTLLPPDGPSPLVDPLVGRQKRAFRVRAGVENTAGLYAGVDGNQAIPFLVPDDDPAVAEYPPGMMTGPMEARLAEGWTRPGMVSLTMPLPLPATIGAVAIEWEIGA